MSKSIQGLSLYNGWRGKVRDIRGSHFYKLVKQGVIPKPAICIFCGVRNGQEGAWNTYHAEEYGSTFKDYKEGALPVCPLCHGMRHLRIKLPNIWARYKQRIKMPNREGLSIAPNLNAVFAKLGKCKDIPYFEDLPTVVLRLDAIVAEPYSGP